MSPLFRPDQLKSGSAISSVEGFRAKTSVTRGKVLDSMEQGVGCGGNSPVAFAKFDPDLYSWKMWGRCLFAGSMKFSGRWPRSGTMRNGIAYRLPPLVPRISGIGYSFLPTPTKTIGPKRSLKAIEDAQQKYRDGLSKFNPGVTLEALIGGIPNPTWVEWLMGFPIGWTDLNVSATP